MHRWETTGHEANNPAQALCAGAQDPLAVASLTVTKAAFTELPCRSRAALMRDTEALIMDSMRTCMHTEALELVGVNARPALR